MSNNFSSYSSSQESDTSPSHYGEVLLRWEAAEHEPLELGPRSRMIVTLFLIGIVAYALYTDSPLMAIAFILIGIVGYLSLHHEPRLLTFLITTKGVIAGNEFYEFETLHSFFIYTEPPFENILSIHTAGKLIPYVHIPLAGDIDVIRDVLDNFIPEEKHEPGLVDTLEKLLHI